MDGDREIKKWAQWANLSVRLPLEPFQSLLVILEGRCDLVVTMFFDPCFPSFVWAPSPSPSVGFKHADEAFKAQMSLVRKEM